MSVTFGGVVIDIIDSISYSQRPHKAKQTLGKRLTQHDIIGTDSKDYVIELSGRMKKTSAALLKTAVSNLDTLNDGAKHVYADTTDTTYDGNYVIETGSLAWDRHINPMTKRFTLRFVQW